jgi:hypothetical protein
MKKEVARVFVPREREREREREAQRENSFFKAKLYGEPIKQFLNRWNP